MNPERVKALYDVCHAYRITTKVPNMKFIHVIADDGTITQKSPYTENGARVFLYAKTDRLVWESKDGRHYTDSIPYESQRLFYELRYMDMCRKYINGLRRTPPRMSRIFFERRDPEPTIFMEPFSSFFIRPTEFNFTNSNVPYTNLTYHKAGNKINGEERFKSYFSVNVNKKLAFGFI